jgi:hypothetical protein
MAKNQKHEETIPSASISSATAGPLVFISHDGRDAEIAEAFSKLLKSVSAGVIKTFRSSDKKGNDGIDFGEEWYKRLMESLQSTSDVVCLFTERSLDRPWILFEAGVAKGRLQTPVFGIALGIPLARVTNGPFYQFQNMEDSEDELIKLVRQIAKRVPALELDDDVVRNQVTAFKKAEVEILKNVSISPTKKEPKEGTEESAIAKLVEEMKILPSRVTERLIESGEMHRRRRSRRIHPMMFEELSHMYGESESPIGILMAASLVRDDAPWLYELAMEVYRAIKSGDSEKIENEISRLSKFTHMMMHGPFIEELGISSKDTHVFLMEFPNMLEHMAHRALNEKRRNAKNNSKLKEKS